MKEPPASYLTTPLWAAIRPVSSIGTWDILPIPTMACSADSLAGNIDSLSADSGNTPESAGGYFFIHPRRK